MIVSRPFSFSMMTGKCHNCGKKLPKKKAYWCNEKCFLEQTDREAMSWAMQKDMNRD